MKAGQLRHRVTIERPISTRNAHGQPITVWEVFKPRVAMKVTELVGRELYNAQQIQPDITLSVECRWLRDILPTFRLLWHDVNGPRTLHIQTPPINADGRRFGMTLLCKEAK